jgi:hypothetical protein
MSRAMCALDLARAVCALNVATPRALSMLRTPGVLSMSGVPCALLLSRALCVPTPGYALTIWCACLVAPLRTGVVGLWCSLSLRRRTATRSYVCILLHALLLRGGEGG